MLKSLHIKNLTVFSSADFTFGKNLNIVIGENGSGKSHILKAAYCAIAVSARGAKDSASEAPTKAFLATAIAAKLRNVLHLEQPARHSALFPRIYSPADVQQKLKQLVKPIDAHPRVVELQNMHHVPWDAASIP